MKLMKKPTSSTSYKMSFEWQALQRAGKKFEDSKVKIGFFVKGFSIMLSKVCCHNYRKRPIEVSFHWWLFSFNCERVSFSLQEQFSISTNYTVCHIMYWIWPQVETYTLHYCVSLLEDFIVSLLLAMLFPFRGNALFRQYSFRDYQLQIK